MDNETKATIKVLADTVASGIRGTIESFYWGGFWDGYVAHEQGIEPWDNWSQERHAEAVERQAKRAEEDDPRYLRVEWITPDGSETAWLIEITSPPGRLPLRFEKDPQILDADDYPDVTAEGLARIVVTEWSSPVPAPILWGPELGSLLAMREMRDVGQNREPSRGKTPLNDPSE